VLTGVDITGYGADLPGRPSLGQMARRLLAQVPELPRLRLTSVDCVEVAEDEELMRLIAEEERLMPHLHLSLQAGDDMVLKRMKRRHARADAIEFCRRARELRPGLAFGADLIAGFPTETDEMFRRSLDLIEECDLVWLHVFPYSARKGTPAARMPQVAKAVRKERAAQLRAAGERAAERFLDAQADCEATVLVERDDSGYSEQFAPVRLTEPTPEGSLVRVRISGREGLKLIGEPVRRAA
jgi:threonylcarbamoyladenosine tRNA methylthiotransferase MtaB